MGLEESALGVSDHLTVELVDCAPVTGEVVTVPPGQTVEPESPVQQAAQATIEQTGADPPPECPHG